MGLNEENNVKEAEPNLYELIEKLIIENQELRKRIKQMEVKQND